MTQMEEALETADAHDRDAAALVDYLRERDVECPLCRYNLRGLRASRCPECGRELTLGVYLAEPRIAAWIVALVPSLLPAGVGVLLVFAIMATGWPMPWTAEYFLFNLTFCAFIAWIPVAATVLAFRRRFMRLGPHTQWWVAPLLALTSAATFVSYVLLAPG